MNNTGVCFFADFNVKIVSVLIAEHVKCNITLYLNADDGD